MTGSEPLVTKVRQPHAMLDLAMRRLKAIKIERLLNLAMRPQPMRLLEIGTGSGGIAHYFATHPQLRMDVEAVDVADNRLETDAYNFQLVADTKLPFADGSFDVVLTNHVIEHVGNRDAQKEHLCEIGRVMRKDGIGYLAVPNRWMLIEPHYKLACLSWLPHGWRSTYLKWRRGVAFYDCEPLQSGELEGLLRETGFEFDDLCVAALRLTMEQERSPDSGLRRFLDRVPDRLIDFLHVVNPTLIYRLSKP